ncbi:hypothetical protein LTS14_006838 [Recurvomyces mirabilis]|uniref:uncharacterized protein n=1 Tax=Recurvomyces mirabilis TaxID=574656 RepID=UPI002DE0F24C|nr:hypothetical protein LTS14_006838 [Recurvomyces mirabilis]
MTLTTFAVVYVLGGLTFLPLLLAAILLPAWLALPRREVTDAAVVRDKQAVGSGSKNGRIGQAVDVPGEREGEAIFEGSAAAGASFAVLRSYHFPSATAALNVRQSSAGSINGTSSGSSDLPDSSRADVAGSESVYQSMYRSVFDRSKGNAHPAASVLEASGEGGTGLDGTTSKTVRKPVISASVFYIVLRHGHLMLYDSSSQVEVRHVISMAHHSISLTDGEEETIKDADLFIKRTAIVLTPLDSSTIEGYQPGQTGLSNSSRPKPFYLFSSTCIEKEDFYLALLSTRASPPIPQPIASEDLIKLQSTLHSTSLTPETRAFNALVSRIFLSIHKTPFLEDLVRSKIEKKISRVQKPSFIAELTVKSIDLGDCAPILSQPRLKDINISGDMTLGFDLKYSGGVQVVIGATARIDLGSRFKARTVDLVLSTSLQRLTGKMLFRIKPSPSNRIWFCFETMPDMDIKVEPIVSTRQITYTFILRAIEDRIRTVVAETLVKPNWDDVPFFDTRSQRVRGGIWADEGLLEDAPGDDLADSSPADVLKRSNEKSASMPALVDVVEAAAISSGISSSGRRLADPPYMTSSNEANTVKRRSVASLPPQQTSTTPRTAPSSPPRAGKPIRSPSFTSPAASAPSIALDDASGVPVRSDDASLQPKKWRSRVPAAVPSRKEAMQAVREMHDRSMPLLGSDSSTTRDNIESTDDESASRRGQRFTKSALDDPDSIASDRRGSEKSTSSSTHSNNTQQQQEKRKTILAATAAATTAARNWSWNTIANRTGRGGGGGPRQPIFRSQGTNSQTSLHSDQPIGRGQPLPPPGTPLPGPQKGIFAGIGNAVAGRGGVRRKPVPTLPQRRTNALVPKAGSKEDLAGSNDSQDGIRVRPMSQGSGDVGPRSSMETLPMTAQQEDEFGPWSENNGGEHDTMQSESSVNGESLLLGEEDVLEGEAAMPSTAREEKVKTPPLPARRKPPPLPARRPTNKVSEASSSPVAVDPSSSLEGAVRHSVESKDLENEPVMPHHASTSATPDESEASSILTGREDELNHHEGNEHNVLDIPDDSHVQKDEQKFAAGQDLDEEDFQDGLDGAHATRSSGNAADNLVDTHRPSLERASVPDMSRSHIPESEIKLLDYEQAGEVHVKQSDRGGGLEDQQHGEVKGRALHATVEEGDDVRA